MSFEFALPMTRDDLLRRTGVNQYVVDEVFSIRSLAGKLKGKSSSRSTPVDITFRLCRPVGC